MWRATNQRILASWHSWNSIASYASAIPVVSLQLADLHIPAQESQRSLEHLPTSPLMSIRHSPSERLLPPNVAAMSYEKRSLNLARTYSLQKNYADARSSFSLAPRPFQRECLCGATDG